MFDLTNNDDNLRYANFIEVHEERDCSEGMCDGICRCRRITGVTMDLTGIANYHTFFEGTYVGPSDYFERALWFWWFKHHAHCLAVEHDVDGGYYGDELRKIWFTAHESDWEPDKFDQMSSTEKIHFLLIKEYGSVLPALAEIKEWEAKCVFTQSILKSDNTQTNSGTIYGYAEVFDHLALMRERENKNLIFQNLAADFMPLCMPVQGVNKLRIVDGRHRFEAFMQTKLRADDKKHYPPVFLWVICPKGTDIL